MKVGLILLTVLALGLSASVSAAHIPRHHEAIKSSELFNILFNVTDIPGFNNGTGNNTLGPHAACYQQYAQEVAQITLNGGANLRGCVQLALQDLGQFFDVNDIQSVKTDFKQQLEDCQKQKLHRYQTKKCQVKTVIEFANKARPYLLSQSISVDQCIEHELFKISTQLNKASHKLNLCLIFASHPSRPTWRPTASPNATTEANSTWTTPINPTGTTPNMTWTTPSQNSTWQPTTEAPIYNTTWNANSTWWPTNTTSFPNSTWQPTFAPNTTIDANATWSTPIDPTGTTPNMTWSTPSQNSTWQPTSTPVWNTTWNANTTWWPTNTTSYPNSTWQPTETPASNTTWYPTWWPNNTTLPPNSTWQPTSSPFWNTTTDGPIFNTTWNANSTWWPTNTTSFPNSTWQPTETPAWNTTRWPTNTTSFPNSTWQPTSSPFWNTTTDGPIFNTTWNANSTWWPNNTTLTWNTTEIVTNTTTPVWNVTTTGIPETNSTSRPWPTFPTRRTTTTTEAPQTTTDDSLLQSIWSDIKKLF